MNPQEQEERDFFPQSELELAYDASRMNREPGDEDKIANLVNAGRFVVTGWHVQYCRSTDAIIGRRKLYIADYPTREQADARMEEEWKKHGDCDGESGILVEPFEPRML